MSLNPFVAASVTATTTSSIRPSSVARMVSAANSENATVVKASAANLFGVKGYKATAAVAYLKFYNKATTPSEADTPYFVIPLLASTTFSHDFVEPVPFTTGLSYRIVTGNADNDDTAVAAGDVLNMTIFYV